MPYDPDRQLPDDYYPGMLCSKEDAYDGGFGSDGWICDLIASHYFPELNLNHAELAADVNRFFQGLGGSKPSTAPDYTEFASRQVSRSGDPRKLKPLFSASRKLYWSIYDANPEFWQTQFSRKSLIAWGLLQFIALVLSHSSGSTSSTRLLQHLQPTVSRKPA